MSASEGGEASSKKSRAFVRVPLRACERCSRRKIRCNNQSPCDTCVKGGHECQMQTSLEIRRQQGQKPRRQVQTPRKKQSSLPSRENVRGESESPGSSRSKGTVILDRGHPRYIENNLWTGLGDELQNSRDILDEPSEENATVAMRVAYANGEALLFGRPMLHTLSSKHPQPVHIFKLWQKFLDNVNPLTKIVHAPTVQLLVLEASTNAHKLLTSTEALMFAIYTSAVNSLTDEECRKIVGESRLVLLCRFSEAAQQALINAEFLRSSNIVVLQAFTLYLLSMRGSYDPQSLWALSGLAIRSGQRIGLHRDNTSENLSVFDAEMRRRLWWQILILDSRSAQLSGSATDRQLYLQWNTRRPLNVNDSDLHPAMQELPVEHPGISEMLFCSMRYEIGNFMRQSMKHENVDENGQMTKTSTSIAAKDRALDELEHHLEQKYLKYCDPSVPHHLLALYLGKSAICRLRLAAHFPRQQSGHNSTSRQDEKDTLFRTCLKTIEYDNDGRKNKSLQGYLWHVNVFFPYEAFIYILIELSERTEGDLVDHAWSQVDKAYENHPELISSSNNALHFAMGNLAIKAWRNRIGAAHIDQQLNESTTPHSILAVQNRRNAKSAQGTQSQHSENSTTPTDSNPTHINIDGTKSDDVSQDPYSAYSPNYGQTDINLLDWESWQALIEGRDLPMSGFDQQMVT